MLERIPRRWWNGLMYAGCAFAGGLLADSVSRGTLLGALGSVVLLGLCALSVEGD